MDLSLESRGLFHGQSMTVEASSFTFKHSKSFLNPVQKICHQKHQPGCKLYAVIIITEYILTTGLN